MPALKVVGLCGTGRKLTTRPFAGDDLHVLCVLGLLYRVIQIACIIPIWIKVFLYRLHGAYYVGSGGYPSWCADEYYEAGHSPSFLGPSNATIVFSYNDTESSTIVDVDVDADVGLDVKGAGGMSYDILYWMEVFLAVSILYAILDIILSLAVWNAASVGTPTEPRGRDASLRWLIWIRVVFMNLLLTLNLSSGIIFVYNARGSNYGCGDAVGVDYVSNFENSPWYSMFCAVMVTFALELLLWPSFILNQICRILASTTKKNRLFGLILDEDGRHLGMAAFMGGCFKCLQCICCNRLGGGKIRAQIHLQDAAVAILEFFNADDANFDIVMSDLWLAFKIMGRVHREQKYLLSERVRLDKRRSILQKIKIESCAVGESVYGDGEVEREGKDINNEERDSISRAISQENDNDDILAAEAQYYNNISGISANRESYSSLAKQSVRLRHSQASDLYHIRQAARHAHYALGVYDHYPAALRGQLVGGRTGVYQPIHTSGITENQASADPLSSCFRLTDYGFPSTMLVYGTFLSDVIQTPYVVLVDEQEKSVVVSIRGTYSIEDMVTDLQFNSSNMSRVGEICGFDGSNMHAHRGVLTRCKWIYNDLTKRKIFNSFLSTDDNSPHYGFKLIFTGHSLGASIAAILGTMFRPKYPNLYCYAFCPPGCSVSLNLAFQCEEYVTSIVVGSDVIPRIRGSNFEMLRFEFLELLSRVKVSKKMAWNDIRKPCIDKDLEARNRQILYPKHQIPASDFSEELESFHQRRKRVFTEINPIETRLDIPGRIIHLVRSSDKYVPHWASLLSIRDIELSLKGIKEHSMDNAVLILDTIAVDYENASRGVFESRTLSIKDEDGPDVPNDSSSFDESIDELSDFSADDRWFVICSRPHGSMSPVPTVLSLAGFACSVLCNSICSLFARDVAGEKIYYDPILTNETRDVAGLVFGLYTNGFMYYQDDADDSVVKQCYATFSGSNELDVYIKLARGMSMLSLIIGFLATCFLLVANCMILGRRSFWHASVTLFAVTLFQSLVFTFLLSERCHADYLQQSHDTFFESCRLDSGFLIAAIVIWFSAASSTAYIAHTLRGCKSK